MQHCRFYILLVFSQSYKYVMAFSLEGPACFFVIAPKRTVGRASSAMPFLSPLEILQLFNSIIVLCDSHLAMSKLAEMDSLLPILTLPLYIYAGTFACLLTWIIIRLKSQAPARPTKTPSKPTHLSRALDREPGTWTPSQYKPPPPTAYPDWSITSTLPLPYRPFKYGPKYPVTMGLRSMPLDEWIELDNQYPQFHHERTNRIAELGTKISQTAPEGLAGAHELLDLLRDYLPARYPSLFRKTDSGIENLLTGEEFNTTERRLKKDAMQIAGSLVQEDVCILVERPDGQYHLAGGAVCTRGVWCLEERLGMPLSQIHISYGKVPHFKEKLEKGVMSLFRRIQPENPVQRNTWYVIGEDAIDGEGFTVGAGERDMPVENFYFKTERQTVRRSVVPLFFSLTFLVDRFY